MNHLRECNNGVNPILYPLPGTSIREILYSPEYLYDKALDVLRVSHETITDPSSFIDNERRRGSHDLEYLAAVEVAVEQNGEIATLFADHIPAALQVSGDLYAEKPETELVLSLLQVGELRKLRNAWRSGRVPDIDHQSRAGEIGELETPAIDISE